MWSAKVTPGVTIASGQQYNRLRTDALASSYLLAHETDPVSTSVKVEAGFFYNAIGEFIEVAEATIASIPAPSTNPRIDLITASDVGVITRTAGTEGASPSAPTVPSGHYLIAHVYCRVGMTEINQEDDSSNGYIIDKRGTYALPKVNELNWVEETTTTKAMTTRAGYLANNAGLITFTLPTTAKVSDKLAVKGIGAGGWKIAQNAGQSIEFGAIETTVGTGGYIQSTLATDYIMLECIEEDTKWIVIATAGTPYTDTGEKLGINLELFSLVGGTGVDGALDGSANVTLTGTNYTYIQKNYTRIDAAAGGGKVFSITPIGCITHIKVQGDANLTDWDFDFEGKGAAGGAQQNAFDAAGNGGATFRNYVITVGGGVGGASTSGGGGGASMINNGGDNVFAQGKGGVKPSNIFSTSFNYVNGWRPNISAFICGGAGGGSGGSWDAQYGGKGGNGGGCLIIEVGGNLTFNGTTLNVSGEDGGQGEAGANEGGGGGGGGGGTLVVVYKGTLTDTSKTVDVSGGAAGLDGDGSTDGGVGATGLSIIQKLQ